MIVEVTFLDRYVTEEQLLSRRKHARLFGEEAGPHVVANETTPTYRPYWQTLPAYLAAVAEAREQAAPPGLAVPAVVQQIPEGPLFSPASELAGREVPPREWLVRDLVPHRTVTLLGGDGGTGKSLLALQLAVAVGAGLAWLHRPIERPGPALFLTAEDDLGEVHRRIVDICRAEGLDLARLWRLWVRSFAGEDTLLAVPDRGRGTLLATPLYAAIDRAIAEARPSAVFLDTLADLRAGEENNRAHARQLIGLLRGLAIRHGCAIVLLAHPSLTGMATGSGLSGSTAWNGSVRSRLYLDRVKDDGSEPDPNVRRLSTKKSNYGPTGEEIALRWEDGVFVADAPVGGGGALDRMARAAKAERVFLKLLAEFNGEGRRVRHTSGDSYAPNAFAKSGRAEGLTKAELRGAMEALFARGTIIADTEGPPSRKVSFLREVQK